MKRIITIAMLLLPALFVACNPNDGQGAGYSTSVVLSSDNVSLQVGQSTTITATVLPASLGMGVTWSVIDEEYASVEEGVITGLARGVTYVVATSADGYQKAACMVSVNPPIEYSVSIKDEMGQLLNGIYGYPGMVEKLHADTSDEKIHTFTWTIEDPAVASLAEDGTFTLNAVESTNPAYVYDAQTFLKVVSEDGQGCKIPVRSSMLKGIRVTGGIYTPIGTPVIVEKESEYVLDVFYEGENDQQVIPADDIELELSNTTDFTLAKVSDAYTVTTGSAIGVASKVNLNLPGSATKTEIGQLRIDEVYAITAQKVASSSSTLVFTWTKGGEVADDIAAPYTVYLYKDEACTEEELHFSIPAGDGCWNNKQPRFVLSGLTPGTDYWFQVVQTDDAEAIQSPVIPATTDAFNIVMVSSDPAAVGDIILAEDFGQFCWGADEIAGAAGYDVASDETAYDTSVASSFLSRNAVRFVKTTGEYAQRSMTAQAGRKESGFRLVHWAQGFYARTYVGPGYLFLSTYKYATHTITPPLNSIPEGVSAKLKITVHAAGKVSGGKAAFAVQHGISFSEFSSGAQTNKNKLDLASNVETITFEGGLTNLQELEVTLEGVVRGDRIAFGPTEEKKETNNNMMLISDITIQILELN